MPATLSLKRREKPEWRFAEEAFPPVEERNGASLWGDGSGRWRGGAGADLAVAHDLRHLLFLHIHGAELPVDRRFERGIGLHAAAGGQLEIAIPAYR